jgi:hypothetical protein
MTDFVVWVRSGEGEPQRAQRNTGKVENAYEKYIGAPW